MTSLISIIVPIYNVEKYLNRCVESIVNQTYKNLEIILVDDGSPDNCPKMCDEWAEKDSRIKVIHKENGGLSSARNAGLDAMSGEYLMFVDSDDYIHAKTLEILYNTIIENDCEMSVGRYIKVWDSKTEKSEFTHKNYLYDKNEYIKEFSHNLGELLSVNMIISCCKLCKRNVFFDIRFPLNKTHEDEFVIHKICNNCNKIVLVDEGLYYYEQRNGSIMANKTFNLACNAVEAMMERTEFFLNSSYDTDVVNAVLYSSMTLMIWEYLETKYLFKNNAYSNYIKKYYKKLYRIGKNNLIKKDGYFRKNKYLFDSFYINEYLFRLVRKIKEIKD